MDHCRRPLPADDAIPATPYGTEWALENEFGGLPHPTRIEFRMGRAVTTRPWELASVDQPITRAKLRSDLRVDSAPAANRGRESAVAESTGAQLGGAVVARVERDLRHLWFGLEPATLVVDVGVKTNGFLPGERLQAGALIRAGVGLPLRP